MDNGLKQRVVGAVVLISLAIIVLPMVLDGHANRVPKISYESEIPAPPEVTAEAINSAEQQENAKRVGAAIEKDRQAPVEQTPGAEPAKTQPAKPAASVPPKPAVAPAPAKPATPAAATPLPPVAETNATPATAEVAVAWTIQLASISNADNAKALRDKLIAKGYRAYVKQSGNVSRVMVGPELKKDRAEAQLQAIAADKAFGLKGMVVRYQP